MTYRPTRIEAALGAQLELLRGGVSGASTYRVHGLDEACVLKVVDAASAAAVRARGYREISFYTHLAAQLPVQTPRVLASRIEEGGACALLIAAYAPLPPASELRADTFADIATQLARLHATYWNRTDRLRTFAWLAPPPSPDLTQAARHARATWQALAQRSQFRELLTPATVRAIEAAVADVQATPEYGPDTPLTLCHGDCHLDNLLRDQAGQLIWADWQEVGIGYGPSDLSFLLQRATATGVDVGPDSIITAYCDALAAGGCQGVDERAIRSAMYESERRTRLLYWPDYLQDAAPEQMAYHLSRIFGAEP